MSLHFYKLKIAEVRRETPDCVSVVFDIPEPLKPLFTFLPGQNITVKALVGNEDLRRSYSICSSPFENELRIAVKEVKDGRFSAWANKNLQAGHELEVLPPNGSFTIETDPAHKRSYLALVAGSGITPVISMVKAVLHAEPGSTFTLVYGNRTRASIIFREEIESLKNRFMHRLAVHHVLSRDETEVDIYQGRITADKCSYFANRIIHFERMDQIFLCGPADLIFSLRDWLLTSGIAREKIHFELFSTPGTALSPDSELSAGPSIQPMMEKQTSEVTVRLDGINYNFDLPFDQNTILDAALDAGADLPFSCKGGVCSTCRAKLLEGDIEMELNYALEPEEVSAGFILCCQSRPVSKRVIIDFDQR